MSKKYQLVSRNLIRSFPHFRRNVAPPEDFLTSIVAIDFTGSEIKPKFKSRIYTSPCCFVLGCLSHKFIMKLAVFTIVLAFGLIVADEVKRCGSSADCGEDECCIVHGFFGLGRGNCKKLAAKDEVCNQKDAYVKAVHGNQYLLFCPCASGLECVVSKVKEFPIIGNVTLEQTCTTKAL
ncbi:hypothetical protein JTE90_013710 [Oedothorax gibbosus]|uniref:Prokineticin domain-containing protein n=1 Tax=Oedothorax gibbosus TaxID=931172 RepID=A0AAV6V017_9ARAC|nr:hypothetical protein JTE90_013710 [Oedothorax gibbosus]